MWACIVRDALNGYSGPAKIYYLEHATPWPAEMKINPDGNRRQCHEKTCHCVSEYWLFGRYNYNDAITDINELDYGKGFRKRNADFVINNKVRLVSRLKFSVKLVSTSRLKNRFAFLFAVSK